MMGQSQKSFIWGLQYYMLGKIRRAGQEYLDRRTAAATGYCDP